VVIHIDFGQMLTSNSRPSRKAHSFGRSLRGSWQLRDVLPDAAAAFAAPTVLGFAASNLFLALLFCGRGSLESECRKRCDHQHPCR